MINNCPTGNSAAKIHGNWSALHRRKDVCAVFIVAPWKEITFLQRQKPTKYLHQNKAIKELSCDSRGSLFSPTFGVENGVEMTTQLNFFPCNLSQLTQSHNHTSILGIIHSRGNWQTVQHTNPKFAFRSEWDLNADTNIWFTETLFIPGQWTTV